MRVQKIGTHKIELNNRRRIIKKTIGLPLSVDSEEHEETRWAVIASEERERRWRGKQPKSEEKLPLFFIFLI